ncbi:uncharacterized protein LOC108034507 [Drosophila biarmipes]|uniref:uncharacterized protein LOC108034507 n=1 Tax=Drosophila biarmipes TaxID=125945 RepID=UPI0007E81618|nr:uncharacterized protein LOC108034507 [Drosophila biarmipes]
MDTLRQKISELFNNPLGTKDEVIQSPNLGEAITSEVSSQETEKPDDNSSTDTSEAITSADLPTPDLKLQKFKKEHYKPINYELEFVDFVERNAPKGFSKKIMDMLPYLQASFLSWPAFWLWRGYNWQSKRKTERIGLYIQRTYQQAKLMQLAILATGLLTVSMGQTAGIPIKLETVDHNKPAEDIEDTS